MARPIKTGGIDYFPLDVDWERKVRLFKAKYKLMGIGMLVTLLQEIYKEGYCLEWNEDTQILFSDEHSIDFEIMNEMVDFAIKQDVFNKDIFDKQNVLTSRGIQKRYLKGCHRRSLVEIDHRFICVTENDIKDNINPDKVTINNINDSNNTTKESKEKESKEKNSKEKDIKKNKVEEDPQISSKNPTKERLDNIYTFEKFWKDYPHRRVPKGKKDCREWWGKYAKTIEIRQKIQSGTAEYAKEKKFKTPGEFIDPAKDPIRFLKQHIWNDYAKKEQPPELREYWKTEYKYSQCHCGGTFTEYVKYYGRLPADPEEKVIKCDRCNEPYKSPKVESG